MLSSFEATLDDSLYDSLWAEYRARCSCCKREIVASKWETLKIKVQYHLVSMDCDGNATD